ncbi:G protein coupled receptor 98-like protein isoform X1 [Oopsacas minuta]|uniref:G protein coupled receptor 98-like protein isoform X1 n=1 Tax=Oopsacas minuta TaxID=111878 RepID=A0AAV7JS41_9METZ|nr:G protein coupled receptor 98-like protein isoform X1 [Oopsacas minuta]
MTFERISSINTNAAKSLSLAIDTNGTTYLLATNASSLFVFSWVGQTFTISQLFHIPGTVNTVESLLSQSVLYSFISVTGGDGLQVFRLSSGVFTQLTLAATPVIRCLDISLVQLDNQLFILTAVEGDSQSLVLTLGSWREGADFFQRRGTSFFANGQTILTLLIQIYPDDIPEITDEFIIQLTNPTNQAVVDEITGVLTVRILTNDDAHGLVGFSPESLSVILPELSSQDTDRQQDFTLDVIRLGGTFGDVVVRFLVTGEAVEDLSPTENTLTFMSGMNTTTLPIRVLDDQIIELSELATVILTEIVSDGNTDPDVPSILGARINPATSSAAVTIQANDYPHGLLTFSVTSRSVTVDEPETGNLTSVTITIIREYGLIGAITIELETQIAYTYPLNQQADPTEDFFLATSQATMLSGAAVASITVSVLPDLTPEITETFWVRIVRASLVDESDRQGSVSDSPRPKNSTLEVAEIHIRPNDEFRGILSFDVTLGQDGTYHISESVGIVVIYINRTSGNFGEIGASWLLESITTAPSDYTPTSGTLTFLDGQAVDTIEFRITDDIIPEMATTFRILLHTPVGGARLGDTELIVTIDESDDVHGLFYFAEGSESFSLQEPGENSTQPSSANLVVLRTKGLIGEVIISWEVEAAADGDVTPLSGQLIYPENSTYADFEISLVDDTIPELEVLYQVRLTSATNGGNLLQSRSIAYLYILPNDNPTGRISISPSTSYVVVEEGSSIQVSLLRTQGAFYRVSVQWRIVPEDGSVVVTQHFLTSSGTAVFDISATTTSIELQTITDNIPEVAQIFTLELLSASIAGSNEMPVIDAGADEATLVVAASDQPHGRIVFQSPVTSSYQESDGIALIAVFRELGTVGSILVNFTVSTSTSVIGQDFLLSKEHILMDDGQVIAYLNLTLLDDSTPELSEVIQFTLTDVSLFDPQVIVTLPPGAFNPGNVEINIPPILGTSTIHTLTIEESDDPYGIIEFSQSVYSVSEGELALIRVNRLRGTIGVQSVQFRISEGRALLGVDFNTGTGTLIGTLIFQDGTASSSIQLQIIDDTTPEDTENFAIILESITGNANLGTTTSAEIDIEISDDPFGVIGFNQGSLSINVRNPTLSEGDLSVSLTVDRIRGTMGSVEVQYQVVPTTPLQQGHRDITPTSDTLTFADGVSQQFIILTILAEAGPEVEEEYIISLAFSTGTLDMNRVNASITIAGRGMPYGVVGFALGLVSVEFDEPEVSIPVGLELQRTLGTFSTVLVYWEATGNVTSSDIDPLSGYVELPHWDGAVSDYPRYNLTFTLLSDTQAENTQVFTIRLVNTSGPTEIDSEVDSVVITIRANDHPHGVFSIDPSSVNISINQDVLSRNLDFTIIRDQGLTSDATVTYSLTYTDYGESEFITLVYNDTIVVSDGIAWVDSYIPISVDTFLGTNGNLTLTLTEVTAEGTAVTGLPPRIANENDYINFIVLQHQANARISFSSSSLSPKVDDTSNTINLVLEREGTFGDVTIGFVTGQEEVTPPLLDGLITPDSGQANFTSSDSSKSISLSLSPNLLTSDPEIFTIRLVEVLSTVRALPSTSAHTAVVEPQGVVGFPTDQLEFSVDESGEIAKLDVFRLFGSFGTIFVSYSTGSLDNVTSMFEELAVVNVDYNRTQGVLELEPYQTRRQISVRLAMDDDIPGTDKLFIVTLSIVVDSTSQLSDSPRLRDNHMTSLVNIVDDDNPAGVFSFSQNKLIVQEEFQLLVITILRDTDRVIFPADISVRTVSPDLATSIGIDYSSLGVNLETTANATQDQDYIGLDEQLVYTLNQTVMQFSLRILDEDIPELDKLVLLQLYNASYKSSISERSLLPIIISANDDSGGILRFSDNSLSLFISEDIMPSIQVSLSRDRGMFGSVSIQWQAKLSPGDTPATSEEISILSTQLVETSGIATFEALASTTNFTLSLKQDTIPELMETFYLQLLGDTINPIAVLDQSRAVSMVTSLQSDFPFGAIEFAPDSRFRTVTSGDIDFTVRLTIEREGGNLGYVLVHYNTPGITQESITLGSYTASNAQIGGHYLSADGTLNFTEGRTEDFIDIQILGNPLNSGETRLLYVDLVPVHPAEGGDFLRATILLTGHGNEFRLLEIYSQQLSLAIDGLDTSQFLLTFLDTEKITTLATTGESLVIRSILDQLISDGVSGSYSTSLQENIFTILSLIIGSEKFSGQSFFANVVESFSYSLLILLPCPMDAPVEMKSSVIEIQAYKGSSSQISGYRFNTNGNTFQFPVGVLPVDDGENCGAQVFIADMTMGSNSIFQDPSVASVFGQTVLSVGLRDSFGNEITSIPSPLTYRVVSPGQVVKFKNSQCIFWDPIRSRWSSEGCSITRQLIEQPFIECQCNHLTNFAADAAADNRYSFGVAMAVACGIVVLAVLFSIVTHFVYYTKFQLVTHLIMNLLISLLLCEVTFLLASLLSPIANEAGCAAIGAILHYFSLVTFLWCLLIVLAVILVVYFGTLAFEHLQLVLYAFFGWLAPAIVILLCIFIVRYGLAFEWAQVYGDVYGNGDLCFIPNFTVNMVTAVAPIFIFFFLSIGGVIILFLMTSTSSNEDLKYDDIYFTSKNTREVFKLLILLIVIGLAWLFSAIHLIVGQLYVLILAILAQIVLAAYIIVVYGIMVIYIFVVARKKSYYPQEDPNDINTSISPVSPMKVDVPLALGPPSYLEDKIYVNPSIPDASSILEGSYPPSDIARSSAMYTEDPEIDDLLYTLKVGDTDQDSYFQNGDTRSEPSVQEVFNKRRISIADTHL